MDVLLFYGQSTLYYLSQMVPSLLVAAVFLCWRPARRRRLAAHGMVSPLRREGALLLFLMFCAGLAALTLFPAGFWHDLLRGHVVWPKLSRGQLWWRFTIFRDLTQGGWLRYMLLGNVVMFAPLGFFPALLWGRPRWWKGLLTALCASVFIEVVQLVIARGSDVNDVILNSLGGLCGYWVYAPCRMAFPGVTPTFRLQKTEVSHGR